MSDSDGQEQQQPDPDIGALLHTLTRSRTHVAMTALAHAPAAAAGIFHLRDVRDRDITHRKTWKNYVGTQVAEPMAICRPQSLDELRTQLQQAVAAKLPVRAVGSGHAWSDAALTDGYTIETHGLARVLDLDATLLRNPGDASTLIHTEAGITLEQLNVELEDRGLALINMGGFDGQTLGGVISTSTHGSGIALGSYPSMVEALIVLTADGRLVQIERGAGISDPQCFAARYGSERTLIQDDRMFDAMVVSMGCLGILYAVILRVMPMYWLSETRTLMPWTQVQELLKGDLLARYRHVEVLINPYKVNTQDCLCLLTTRELAPEPTGPADSRPFRYAFGGFVSEVPEAGRILAFLFNEFPQDSPKLLNSALQDLEDTRPYVDVSSRIFNIGHANSFRAISAEFGVDVEVQLDAVNAVIQAAEQFAAAGAYHSSPIAMRWVAPSPGMMSMQPRATCMLEFPMLYDVFGSDGLLWRYENLLTGQFGARPHWGQRNFLNGGLTTMRSLYPRFDEWLAIYKQMDPAGRFQSRFSDRIGITA